MLRISERQVNVSPTVARTRVARADSATGDQRGSTLQRWGRFVPVAMFLVLAASVVGFHMAKYPYLSPIDENVHFDYLRRLPEIPSGTMSQDSLRMTACRGYSPALFDRGLATYQWPPCKSETFDPAAFPGGGKSTAGTTAPLYYFVTAALTRPIAYVIDMPLLPLVRAANALWLAALMTVAYWLARRLRATRLAAGAAAVILGTSSDVVTSASTVGPDTATAVTGGLILLMAVSHDGSRRSTVFLLGAVLLGALTKLTAFTAVGAAMIVLLGRAIMATNPRRPRPVSRATGTVAAVFALFTVLSLAWFMRPALHDTGDAATQATPRVDVDVPWSDIPVQLFFNFLPPNIGNYNAEFLEGLANTRLEQLMTGLLMFGVLAGALALRRAPAVSALGFGVIIMAALGPVFLTALNDYAYDQYFALPPRYGYGLLTGFAALMAWTFRGPVAARALAVIAGASLVNIFI